MTSDRKWTPGPWSLEKPNRAWIGVSSEKHCNLAKVVWRMSDDRLLGRNSPEKEANAHLIAAAPELYEALEAAMDAIIWWENEHTCCAGATDKEMNMARAALAKARGEA